MLLGDFFTLDTIETTPQEIKGVIMINASHKVFDGHFPGQPVVPGVCMMQMLKEIFENVLDKKTDLVKAPEMKFLAVIDPSKNNLINVSLKYTTDENGAIILSASFSKAEITYFKFKGIFTVS